MVNLNAGCTVALYRECNHATKLPTNATTNATETQPSFLKVLAMRVLERNQRNLTRNSSATGQLRWHQNSATQNCDYAIQDITEILQRHGLTVGEIMECAGEDWADIKNNEAAINSLAALITDIRLRVQGKVPPSYKAKAHCNLCGDVFLPPVLASVNPILGCPWCWNLTKDIPIPRQTETISKYQ